MGMNKPSIVVHPCKSQHCGWFKQEDHEIKAKMGYIVRPSLKKTK
jgi:hypothetical protein